MPSRTRSAPPPSHRRSARRHATPLGAVAVGAILVMTLCGDLAAQEKSTAPGFGRDVRPILAGRCFKCHGPDEGSRAAKLRLDLRDAALAPRGQRPPAIVPGHPEASPLLLRVRSNDPELRMPPKSASPHPLTADEIRILEAWVADGAPYEVHWAFVPPAPGKAPQVLAEDWVRKPLDRYVLARLEAEGLAPSPPASRERWLRRVSLDLVGLPPSEAQVARFTTDLAPGAEERAIDRLLASPHFGERWARFWLDLARYADTKGYEKDGRRTMWPYRDWVIRAFDADLPFDSFSFLQLAGDLDPATPRRDLVATAFHRNTMTNDEGGTDNEEFRTAAVIDRVNTTMEIWQGLTAGCAQCHAHKFDPITHTDYYGLYALFDNTADADHEDDRPTMPVIDVEAEAELARLDREIASAETAIAAVCDAVPESVLAEPEPPPATSGPIEIEVCDERVPPATRIYTDRHHLWSWNEGPIPPYSGRLSFGAAFGGLGQHFFEGAAPIPIRRGDVLVVAVFVDPTNPPKELMLQWHSPKSGWEHRAYFGDDRIDFGRKDTKARLRIGDLPPGGRWIRLEIPAAEVGLEGDSLDGWAFSQFGGKVEWDAAAVRTSAPLAASPPRSFGAWVEARRGDGGARLPEPLREAVRRPEASWTAAERQAVRRFWLRFEHRPTRDALAAREVALQELHRAGAALRAEAPSVPVLRELTGKDRRTTRRFERGSFLSPAEEVRPGVPEALRSPGAPVPADRAAFARWLFAPENPLTARVIVNRFWEQLFGAGLVTTLEDFGTQGAWPEHRALLDHLALRFRELGFRPKALLREIVLSATYRQTSDASEGLRNHDPENRLLARGPRFRLDAEMLRDQALFVAGLLSEKRFGPPVYPPQPAGLWDSIIYSGDAWRTSEGEDRHRRSLYTFWRRTLPHPAMTTFDAPSREICTSRRVRTNTPLQALVTLNDPQFVEAAEALSEFGVSAPPAEPLRKTLARLFARVLVRKPEPAETEVIATLHERELVRAHREGRDDAAARRRAWIAVATVLLNLDETLTKE